jgi:ATP-dependent Lon protease
VEKFVVTPEIQSEDSIGDDPLPPGQIWTISPGGPDEHAGLYRIEVNEFTVQLRAFDPVKTGGSVGLGALLALCSALLEKSIKGGLIVVGGVHLGGSINPVHNAISVAELAVEKGASLLLMPVSARRQLFELSDEMATKIDVQCYADVREALLKALSDERGRDEAPRPGRSPRALETGADDRQ